MTTLAQNLSDSATQMWVNAAVAEADRSEEYTIDTEVVRVTAYSTTVMEGLSPERTDYDTLWQIERGVGPTTVASHTAGATLTPFPGAGGGAVTPTLAEVLAVGNDTGGVAIVSETTDAFATASMGANVTGDADATAGDTALVTGNGNANITTSATVTGNGGINIAPTATIGGDGDIVSDEVSIVNGDGSITAGITATVVGAGGVNIGQSAATSSGAAYSTVTANSASGTASALVDAYSAGAGAADVSASAHFGATVAGMSAVADGTSGRMAFNGVTPIAIPVIPASPTEQDIADVLVALGLAIQTP